MRRILSRAQRQGAVGLRRRTHPYRAYLGSFLCSLRQKLIELVDGSFPERFVTRNPSACLFKRSPAQPKQMYPSFYFALHYAGLFKDFQVFGDCGLGRTEVAPEIAGATGLAVRQRMNHRTSGAVREGVKGEIKDRAGM